MKVRKIRRELHISLKEISNYLELPIFVYIYYEVFGITLLHADILYDLCDLLNIDYQEI